MSCSVWNDVQLQLLSMLSQSQGKTSNADRKKLFKELQLRNLVHFQDGVTTSVFFSGRSRQLVFSCFFLQQVRCNFEIWQSPAFGKFPDQQEPLIGISHPSILSINKTVGTGIYAIPWPCKVDPEPIVINGVFFTSSITLGFWGPTLLYRIIRDQQKLTWAQLFASLRMASGQERDTAAVIRWCQSRYRQTGA